MGPVGAHLSLTDDKWSTVLEAGSMRNTLSQFIVDSHHDLKVLQVPSAAACQKLLPQAAYGGLLCTPCSPPDETLL